VKRSGAFPQYRLSADAITYRKGDYPGHVNGLVGVDADLVAANILSGATIFGVAGAHVPVTGAPNDVAVAHDINPYISTYPWTPGTGFGVKYADPATKPTGSGYGVAFCGNTDVAVAHANAPYISTYPWTPGTGFGVKYADPATKPTSTGVGVAFCGNTDVAVAHDINPYVSTYPWTHGTGFGVKYADPATKPTGIGRGVAFLRGGFWLS
jgi:hypothetical protein